ncbi:MAG TPA: polymer-forming cytoskeletal protein [Rhizomicrobium sp.]|nr:polymer-forming cytoskeletal protein [Rhizomicrobium sp.]
MSMFTRNDKGPDPAGTKAPEKKDAPLTGATGPVATATVEPNRPRAMAQPLAGGTAPTGASVISRALKITGQLESSEDIEIQGQVEGDVRAASVRVGQGAKVHGTVYGEEVELAGTVDGKIEARKVVLTASAHMSGDVVHQDISIQSGAYISGHLKPEYGKTESNVQPLHKREGE